LIPSIPIMFETELYWPKEKLILIFGSIIALALVGWAVWLAIPKKETAPVTTDTETEQVAVDTPAAVMDTSAIVVKDSTPVTPPDSAVTANVPTATGSFRLQVDAFKTMAAAENRVAKLKLRGFDVRAEMKDSSRYIVVLQVNRPLSDSSYVMDSLRKNYLWKPKLLQ
jgi:cell division protein FtsN